MATAARRKRGIARKKARRSIYLSDDDDDDDNHTGKENEKGTGERTRDENPFGPQNHRNNRHGAGQSTTAADHGRHSGDQGGSGASPSRDSLFLHDSATATLPPTDPVVDAHFSLEQELFPDVNPTPRQQETPPDDVFPSTAKVQGFLDEIRQLCGHYEPPSSPPVVTATARDKKKRRKPKTQARATVSANRPRENTSPAQPTRQPAVTAVSMGNYIPPSQQRNMRACMVCSIVRTAQQFQSSGCPNCESFLELQGSADAVQDCTSQVFEGLITVTDTQKSWVARYQRLEGYVPGVYAVQVEGILPDEIIEAAANAGVRYIPRDGSANEALPTES